MACDVSESCSRVSRIVLPEEGLQTETLESHECRVQVKTV